MINKYLKRLTKSQSGYASFVVTLVTIIVVSLIVVAFATDSRFEQKNSLANNEATQAYYAAESGINDAYAVVNYDINNPPNTIESTGNQCASSSNNGRVYVTTSTNSNQLNGSNVQYTCLIVNSTPTSILKPVTPGEAVVVPVNTTTPLDTITISWQDSGITPTFIGCPAAAGSFTQLGTSPVQYNSGNCGAGTVQADLLSGNNLTNPTTGELSTNPYSSQATTVFLEPIRNNSSAGVLATGSASQDSVIGATCGAGTGPYACTAQISVPSDTTYYLHLQAFYAKLEVSISVSAGGTVLPISNSQILIDSTGEADGQLKRIQERICDNSFCNNGAPGEALLSTQCVDKDFPVYPGQSNKVISTC